ncbi:MAG: hypothetical protein ABT19_02755 [Rhodanobacter sp. SCN 68-63]|nr:MAG: hypothetical protein ABT19_02755 [Rhodanobacter sp. SCN 68-63]
MKPSLQASLAPRRSIGIVALVFSASTLLCCALPLVLVALGLGSVVATLTFSAPWLVTLSHYKTWTFLVSALVLGVGGYALYRPGRHCPSDPVLAQACQRADRWSRRLWWGAVLLWGFAAFVAYAWLPLQRLFS